MKELFGKTIPSEIKDPFNAKCIELISLRAERSWFGKERSFHFYGYVNFTNGNTEGTQRFEANNLSELFTKVAEFCASLER
jgi:hypothetical protein